MRNVNFIASTLALALAATAHAGVGGGTSADWLNFPGALNDYSNANRPYWDNKSMDGGNRNIGNWINGSYTPNLPAGSQTNALGTTPQYYGYAATASGRTSSGSDAPDVIAFTQDAGVTYRASQLVEVAGYAPYNEIGWYDTTDKAGFETLHTIFKGSDAPVTTVDFTPSPTWGLYIRSYKGYSNDSGKGWLFFSDSSRNRTKGFEADAVPGQQHFAIFSTSTQPGVDRYIVGTEDLTINHSGIEGIGDFNDVIFTLEAVPTPGAAALLGMGGLAALRRRR